MSTVKTLYPVASSVAITCAIGGLVSDAALLAGRASTAVDNTTNLDLDHLLSGVISAGTSPTAGTVVEVWAYAAISIASNVGTFPDGISGTDAPKAMTSANVKYPGLRLVAAMAVDSVTGRNYAFGPVSIASLFGGYLPQQWGVFVVHSTVAALNAAQVALQYARIQTQVI